MRESGLLMPLFQRLLFLVLAILADPVPVANRPRPPRSSILSLTLRPPTLWERSGRRFAKIQTDIAGPIVSLTKLGNAAMLGFKPNLGHAGDIGSNHDDQNHRTQASGAAARRRTDAHGRCNHLVDLPDSAGAHSWILG